MFQNVYGGSRGQEQKDGEGKTASLGSGIGSQSIQLKYRLHGGLEGGKAGWGSCRGKPWMHSWGVYILISLEREATKVLGGQGLCSANNNEPTMVRWLRDCPVTNQFFTVFMGYTLVYCRSSPRALFFDTICVVTHSQFIAFNGGKDGSHFLLICFISDCFTVLHANQEDRSAEPCQLSNDGGSRARKTILSPPSINYVRPPEYHNGASQSYVMSFPWTCWTQTSSHFNQNGLLLLPRTFRFTSDGKSLYFFLLLQWNFSMWNSSTLQTLIVV